MTYMDVLYSEDLSTVGMATLRSAWQVHVLDPAWGRNGLLRRMLEIVGTSDFGS